MRMPSIAFTIALLALAAAADANQPPAVDHQPALCTIAGSPLSLCAAVSDDSGVAVARVYFRSAGEKYFSYVNMAFAGFSYCATLPAPQSKNRAIEYYVQAVDDAGEPTRSSTFRMAVQPETECSFPPLEKDAARAAAIQVFATNQKQGKKLGGGFSTAGVTFVPAR